MFLELGELRGRDFKEAVDRWGWELSTEGFGFDPELIWVDRLRGDEELGLGPDIEAIEIWRSIGVPEERIVALPRSENFWQAGDTVPAARVPRRTWTGGRSSAGPTTGPATTPTATSSTGHLVFMTYDLGEDGALSELPMKSIDTGMGLERMAARPPGRRVVFDTDALRPSSTSRGCRARLRTPRTSRPPGDANLVDHSRGGGDDRRRRVPSNEERGDVLRRILRRAIHCGRCSACRRCSWSASGRALDILGPCLPRAGGRARDGDPAGSTTRRRASGARWIAACRWSGT